MRTRSRTLFIFALAWVASAPGLAASIEERLTPACHATGRPANRRTPKFHRWEPSRLRTW